MNGPFIIYALPRSRTYWLSRFLTYGDYQCGHDQSRYARCLDDVKSWFGMDFTGTVETLAAPWWRLVQHYRPDIKTVVIRRPVEECVESWLALDLDGVCEQRRDVIEKTFRRLDHKLDQVEQRVPGALSVRYDDLNDEATCARVFERCLSYKHDHEWWSLMAANNLQCDVRGLTRYVAANQRQISVTGGVCRQKCLALLGAKGWRWSGETSDGVTIQEESLDALWRDGKRLMGEHCLAVGDPEDNYLRKNWPLMRKLSSAESFLVVTARMNGRMIGYLATVLGPSLEEEDLKVGVQTVFFASQDAAGLNLGPRMQYFAIEAARKKGAEEIMMRAGVRGSGPRMGALYRRLGAEPFGEWYKLDLRAA